MRTEPLPSLSDDRWVLIALLMALLPGCHSADLGKLGNAHFAEVASRGCGPCVVDRPFLVGVRESLQVTPDGDHPGALSARSSAPLVLAAGEVSSTAATTVGTSTFPARFDVVIEAVGPGVATLSLLRADGSTYDELDVRVEEPTSIEVVAEGCAPGLSGDGSSLALGVYQNTGWLRCGLSDDASITAYARGASDRLFGANAIRWELSGGGVAGFWIFLSGTSPTLRSEHVFLRGLAPGAATAVISAGSLRRTLAVTVSR